MYRDYQELGVCYSTIVAGGSGSVTVAAASANPAEKFDFMTVVCLESGSINDIVLRFPSTVFAPSGTATVTAGTALYGLTGFTPEDGRWQVYFHKS